MLNRQRLFLGPSMANWQLSIAKRCPHIAQVCEMNLERRWLSWSLSDKENFLIERVLEPVNLVEACSRTSGCS